MSAPADPGPESEMMKQLRKWGTCVSFEWEGRGSLLHSCIPRVGREGKHSCIPRVGREGKPAPLLNPSSGKGGEACYSPESLKWEGRGSLLLS